MEILIIETYHPESLWKAHKRISWCLTGQPLILKETKVTDGSARFEISYSEPKYLWKLAIAFGAEIVYQHFTR